MMEMSRQMVLFPLIAGFETKDYRRRRSRKKIVIGCHQSPQMEAVCN